MNTINTTPPSEPIDRDIPNLTVGKKKSNMTLLALAGAALLAIIVIVTGIAMYMNQLQENKREKVAEQAKARPKEDAAVVAKADFRTAQARITKEEAAMVEVSASEAEEAAALKAAAAHGAGGGNMAVPADAIGVTATGSRPTSAAYVQSAAAPSGAHGGVRTQTRAERQMDGEVLVVGGDSGKGFGDDGSHLAAQARPTNQAAGRTQVAEPVRGGLDDKVKPSALLAGRAGQRPDLGMLLRRNTAIPCGTVTRIVSEHAGSVMCVVANDVYSADGSVVLVERGSVAHGERREAMMQGQARIGVIWSRIDTPYGVYADVNSLATDALGATGIPADVDNHLSERFGGAVLLSLIGDFGQALANKSNNSGGTIQFSNTSTAGQDLASKTLEHTINIPPTGYVNQGAATTILVLRDMDFRGVYELARR